MQIQNSSLPFDVEQKRISNESQHDSTPAGGGP
jgi:hypothetical protein